MTDKILKGLASALVVAAMSSSPVFAAHVTVHTNGHNHPHYANGNANVNVNVYNNGYYHHGGYYNHYHPALAVAAGMAIGAALTYRPPNCTTEVVNGVTYCYDGLNWYQVKGTTYIVVVRP